jgi:hypothetical protein
MLSLFRTHSLLAGLDAAFDDTAENQPLAFADTVSDAQLVDLSPIDAGWVCVESSQPLDCVPCPRGHALDVPL